MGSWETSDRKLRLPRDWTAIVKRILKRDGHRCTWIDYEEGRRVRCVATVGLEVDHIVPGDDHRDENLRTLCREHHWRKTAREAGAGRAKRRAEIHRRFRREPERHAALAEQEIPEHLLTGAGLRPPANGPVRTKR